MSQVTRILDPRPIERLEDYVRDGGGEALTAATLVDPDALISTVTDAGLRGRGGAGFPTGRKWTTIVGERSGDAIPVVVNAAEGEPGTFKDRMLLRRNPYRVLEGACIAALAVGAEEIIIATKAAFTHEIERLEGAITEIGTAGWVDGIDIRIVTGPGQYLFGEETALLEVVDGRPSFPRVMAPYRRGVRPDPARADTRPAGRDGTVALVDNVETLANVPGIISNGAEWFRAVGTDRSPGTILCTVSGDTKLAGVGEFAMGTPLREVIETLGEEMKPGRTIAAVLGGVSSAPIDASQLDTAVSYEAMAGIGAGLGSASFIVIDDATPLTAVAAGVARFLAIESCGQCEPCKRDGLAITAALAAGDDVATITEVEDRLTTVARGARCALAGQTERVVGRLLELAATHPGGTSDTPYPIVPMVDLVGGRAILDLAHLDKRADWTYPGDDADSGLWPVHRLADHPVEVGRVHTTEPDQRGDDSTIPEVFAPLRELHRQLEQQLAVVRATPLGDVHPALLVLRNELERHRRVTERLIYPLVERIAPGVGDDVAWYPEHRELHAIRLAERLDLGSTPISSGLIDELCADVHVSIIELDLRVIPLLSRHMAADVDEEMQIAGDVTEEISDRR